MGRREPLIGTVPLQASHASSFELVSQQSARFIVHRWFALLKERQYTDDPQAGNAAQRG